MTAVLEHIDDLGSDEVGGAGEVDGVEEAVRVNRGSGVDEAEINVRGEIFRAKGVVVVVGEVGGGLP